MYTLRPGNEVNRTYSELLAKLTINKTNSIINTINYLDGSDYTAD